MAEEAVYTDPGVEIKTDRPMMNQLAEERRKREGLEARLNQMEEEGNKVNDFKQRLTAALGGDPSSNGSPNEPPDPVEDPAAHARWLDKNEDEKVEQRVKIAADKERGERVVETRRTNNKTTTDRFREENSGWLTDQNFGDFARLVNTKIVPTGENRSLTPQDLEDAALIFRKGEILADAASQGQRQAIQGVNMALQNRVGTGRRVNQSAGFGDMDSSEQAEILLSSTSSESERLMTSLPDAKKREILRLIDPDTVDI